MQKLAESAGSVRDKVDSVCMSAVEKRETLLRSLRYQECKCEYFETFVFRNIDCDDSDRVCTLRAEEGEVRGGAGSWSEQGRADNSRAAGRQGSQVTSAHKQDN